jgi:hypothetical protein
MPGLKYVEYGTGEQEVYDLTQDPDERNNVATRTKPDWLARMSALARALGACAGDACRQLEASAPARR